MNGRVAGHRQRGTTTCARAQFEPRDTPLIANCKQPLVICYVLPSDDGSLQRGFYTGCSLDRDPKLVFICSLVNAGKYNALSRLFK